MITKYINRKTAVFHGKRTGPNNPTKRHFIIVLIVKKPDNNKKKKI